MTDIEPGRPLPLPLRQMLALAAAALTAATLIAFLFVLPYEYGIDPTGFGRLTSLTRPAAEAPKADAATPPGIGPLPASTQAPAPFRSDLIEIRLKSPDSGPVGSELEYKVGMAAGATLVYSLTVVGVEDPEEFYYDFHGETPAGPGHPQPVVAEYRKGTGTTSHGALTAPIDGVHGWYLQNQSGSPALVRLRLSGFYELVAPGTYGNLARITPTPSPP